MQSVCIMNHAFGRTNFNVIVPERASSQCRSSSIKKRDRERELALTSPYNLAQSIQACKIQPSFTKSVLICINYVYLVLHYHISSWIVFANQAITTSTCQGLLPLREFVTKFCFGTRLAIHLHQSIKRLLVSGPWLETLVKNS